MAKKKSAPKKVAKKKVAPKKVAPKKKAVKKAAPTPKSEKKPEANLEIYKNGAVCKIGKKTIILEQTKDGNYHLGVQFPMKKEDMAKKKSIAVNDEPAKGLRNLGVYFSAETMEFLVEMFMEYKLSTEGMTFIHPGTETGFEDTGVMQVKTFKVKTEVKK